MLGRTFFHAETVNLDTETTEEVTERTEQNFLKESARFRPKVSWNNIN